MLFIRLGSRDFSYWKGQKFSLFVYFFTYLSRTDIINVGNSCACGPVFYHSDITGLTVYVGAQLIRHTCNV